MDISNPLYFYENFVGYMPEDEDSLEKTTLMIEHYIESGLKEYLYEIYTCSASIGVLDKDNIPSYLWDKNNLIDSEHVYLHSELKLTNKAPEFNPIENTVTEYSYYSENIEYYSIDDIIKYLNKTIKRNKHLLEINKSSNAQIMKYLLDKYSYFKKEDLDPLDIILTLIDLNKENKNLHNLLSMQDMEELAIESLINYREKLKANNKHKITWRGILDG